MACRRGRANPNAATKLLLFTDSGGYCQNPACNKKLFVNQERRIHIAEMAHIIAAMDDGPRADAKLPVEQRGQYENIILLCADCHTEIDKDPETYTDGIIRGWKNDHSERLANAFGIRKFDSRQELRVEVQKLLSENRAVHEKLGPDNEYKDNPEAPEADAWRARMLSTIIPNSNLVIRYLDANIDLLTPVENYVISQFKLHVRGLILRHVSGSNVVNVRFPQAMNAVAE